MMINLMEDTIADIPVLHVVKAELHKETLPTVLYFHGFNAEKESSLTLAYKIAEKGFRVILPDCLYHGARKKEMTSESLELAFWDVVMETLEELPVLKDALVEQGYCKEDRIGIGGTSMGGMITFGALVRYDWVKAAAVLMGTAYMTDYATELIDAFNKENERQITQDEKNDVLEQLASDDMSLHPHTLQSRPLLIWHGEKDVVVPYKYSTSFYESILSHYDDKEKIRFISEPNRAHHISKLSMDEAARWFNIFL